MIAGRFCVVLLWSESSVVGVETPKVVTTWNTVISPWGDCFQQQVSQQIIKVKIIAVQPQRMAGLSCRQEMWKSESKCYFQLRLCYYFKWIFSDSRLKWSHPQEGLYDSHFFPSGFRSLWVFMKGNNPFEYFLNLVLDGVVLTVAAGW